MAPDRPENSDQDGGGGGQPVIFGFCESFGMKDAENHQYYVEETTATAADDTEVVIEASDAKPPSTQQSMDDDLTSLSWLHQQNLLKGLEIPKTAKDENILNNNIECDDSLDVSENASSVSSLDDSLSHESNEKPGSPVAYDEVMAGSPKNTQELAKSPESAAQSDKTKLNNHNNNNNNNNDSNSSNPNANLPVAARNKHPNHVPYDPYLHRNCKPPYSFSCLIFMAIEDSPVKALPVKEVYAWILEHFPYFRNATPGWKNSVRHNLSLNKCFRKVEKSPNLGKGSLWMVDAQYRPNLLQALSRSPYPPPKGTNLPGSGKPAEKNGGNNQRKVTNTRLPDPILFPYLSKRLASSNIDDNAEIEFDSDVDAAAAAMLAFKHGPIILNHNKERKKKPAEKMVPVITRSSIEDHTYSLITSVRLCERRHLNADNTTDFDEQRKIAEGADALLNLAGVATNIMKNSLASQDDDYENNYAYKNREIIHRFVPDNEPLEIRPIKKRRTSTSGGDGPNKRRKIRPWQETWNENGRYLKQVRG